MNTAIATNETVRLHLATGASVGGRFYEADEAGYIFVPPAVAEQLKPHLMPAVKGPLDTIAVTSPEIVALDGEIASKKAEYDTLKAAARNAGQVVGIEADTGPSLAEIETTRRKTIGDWVAGLVKRADVDAVEKQRAAAAARAAQQAKARELAAIGVEELGVRMREVEVEHDALVAQRAEMVREIVREAAEAAAAELLATGEAYARCFAVAARYTQLLGVDPHPHRGALQLPAVQGLKTLTNVQPSTSLRAWPVIEFAVDPTAAAVRVQHQLMQASSSSQPERKTS